MSNNNWKDLKQAESTISQSGSLARPGNLVRIDEDIWDACPEPPETRLHKALLDFPAIAKLCKPFEMDAWTQEACLRAANGAINPIEREALYARILAESKLSVKALAAVRRSPVVKDLQVPSRRWLELGWRSLRVAQPK